MSSYSPYPDPPKLSAERGRASRAASSPAYSPAQVQAPRSVGVAYLLLVLTGVAGFHRFYLGKVGSGVAYLLTLGFLGVGLLVDIFLIPHLVREFNRTRATYPTWQTHYRNT